MTECQQKIKELREITGMNRRQFCEAFEIPYRTVTEWERGTRNAPKYVLKFMEYYIQNEKVKKENEEEAYRHIQKCSMDSGTNMVETAQMLLMLMYDEI